MEIKESQFKKGWVGFYTDNCDGNPEEFLSVKTIKMAEGIIARLSVGIIKLKKERSKQSKGSLKDEK